MLQYQHLNGPTRRLDNPILCNAGLSILFVLGEPVIGRRTWRCDLNCQVRRTSDFLLSHSLQMSVQEDDEIGLKHIFWPQFYIDGTWEHSSQSSQFDMHKQVVRESHYN